MNIYIHIPFCHQKCHYCYYYSFVPGNKKIVDDYLFYLEKEFYLRNKKSNFKKLESVDTVYIGGGTPNYLSDNQLERLFAILKKYLDLTSIEEFVVELNPAACSAIQLEILKKNGVTRLSFGIQTLNANILKKINRYNVDDPLKIIMIARKMGFVINLDFMLGLPGQKMKDVEEAVRFVKKIKPESSFWCELRLGTEQIKKYSNIPSHGKTIEMYEFVRQDLAKMGYRQIIPEYFSNKKTMPLYLENWWTSQKSLGFGLSAFSKIDNIFSKNVDNFEEYVNFLEKRKLPVRYLYRLTKEEEAFVYFVSELKKGFADLNMIRKKFKVDLKKKLEVEIKELVLANLIIFKKGKITFSKKGFVISSPVSNMLMRRNEYLVKIMDTAFNFIDNMPNLEMFMRKYFVILEEGKDRKMVFASSDKKSIGILEKYDKN